jgi:DNA-binding MarR family transcriptional regulator
MTLKAQDVEVLHDPLEDHLGYQLRRVAVLIQADLTNSMEDLQLIPTSAAIMLVLYKKTNIIQVELARILGLQRTNVSPLIINLEKRGFVNRVNQDGRSQYIELTDEGKAQIEHIVSRLEQHTIRCFSHLPAADLATLESLIAAALHDLDPQTVASIDSGITEPLSYQILRTSSLAMSRLVKNLASLQLIPSNASAILVIAANPGIIQSDLGRRLGIKRANISTIISEFSNRNLVDVKSSGRSHLLYLSEQGKMLVPEIQEIMKQHEQNCFGQLDQKNIRIAINALLAIRQQLKKPK